MESQSAYLLRESYVDDCMKLDSSFHSEKSKVKAAAHVLIVDSELQSSCHWRRWRMWLPGNKELSGYIHRGVRGQRWRDCGGGI